MRFIKAAVFALLIFSSIALRVSANEIPNEKLFFNEIWAYLMSGEEQFFNVSYPITDLAYFAGEIDNFGKLSKVPKRSTLKNYKGRVHLVIAQVSNRALTHFALSSEFPLRKDLINDIGEAAKDYDGLQIDFELVNVKDKEDFYSFLKALKKKIGKKPLSVAVGARTKYIDDAYEYAELSKIVDRIIIMAYDEHWSGSKPGSIASMAWCQQVAKYSASVIPQEKLVMGLPFYGRAWASSNPARAYKFSAILDLIKRKNVELVQFKEGIPYFEYQETVNVTVYFENAATVVARSGMYRDLKIKNIAFWRLGQEEIISWNFLGVKNE
ncbi:MAG: glycoside hydrolase [Elusimicrobiota bacterium]|jgi:spore germination protein YaaH|nr:glycoside hydrolase [Elusimicrobiota bacterium]